MNGVCGLVKRFNKLPTRPNQPPSFLPTTTALVLFFHSTQQRQRHLQVLARAAYHVERGELPKAVTELEALQVRACILYLRAVHLLLGWMDTHGCWLAFACDTPMCVCCCMHACCRALFALPTLH